MKKVIFLLLLLIFNLASVAQNHTYRSPLDIPLILSANFGELRPNHFHTGIDFKTQGVENKPVYSIEDGYVSRISVSPSGYGLAIYVNHVTGQTSACGHVNKFAPKIAEYVKNKQYEKESYRVDLKLGEGELPVKKGELIAYSGNTGSSGGPHVHFEIRETETDLAIDPLPFYQTAIADGAAPQLKGIAVYPIESKGVVNNSSKPFRENITAAKTGGYAPIKEPIKAWGKIGVGVYTIDRMTGTHNIYGVKRVRLFLDNLEIFASDITSVNFDKTRMINSMTDFEFWYNKKIFYQKSFVEPGNTLDIYKTTNNGYIDVNEEKVYKLRYELEDLYGNQTTYFFDIQGKVQDIPQPEEYSQLMKHDEDNYFSADLFSLTIPQGNLYSDLYFSFQRTLSSKYLSSLYRVHKTAVPLHGYCDMTIKLTKDSLLNKAQYGIVRINGDRQYWVGGTYNNGAVTGRIRELGSTYAVSYDTKAPVITPVTPAKWVNQQKIVIRLADNLSGITSYRGTINGEFVLFAHDVKKPLYIYKFDPKHIKKGQVHKLAFTAKDACGNESTYEYEFKAP